jgi:hypothetical protein
MIDRRHPLPLALQAAALGPAEAITPRFTA